MSEKRCHYGDPKILVFKPGPLKLDGEHHSYGVKKEVGVILPFMRIDKQKQNP